MEFEALFLSLLRGRALLYRAMVLSWYTLPFENHVLSRTLLVTARWNHPASSWIWPSFSRVGRTTSPEAQGVALLSRLLSYMTSVQWNVRWM